MQKKMPIQFIREPRFSEYFLAYLENLELRALACGSNLTEICREIGISRSTPDRWRRKVPKTIAILDKMEDFLERTHGPKIKKMPCQLYRHFSGDGTLLYVGISLNAVLRQYAHKTGRAPWFTQIAKIEIETFSSKYAAMEAERKAIKNEKPLYNVLHNLGGERLESGELTNA